MPYADNDGIRIHYEIEGQGPPLILQHGFSDSLESWYEFGYVDALRRDHQLILIDARGHGASDKPHHTAAYTKQLQASDVVAVMDKQTIPRADYMGYSMGGRIGFAMAEYAPERVCSLLIGGAAGIGLSRIGHPFLKALRAHGSEGIPEIWGVPLTPSHRERLRANDSKALDACLADNLGYADVLPTMTMACLVYAGTADPIYPLAEATVAEMPNVTFITLPGLAHAEGMLRSDLVLPHVFEFLSSVKSAS